MKQVLTVLLCLLLFGGCAYTETGSIYYISGLGFSNIENGIALYIQYINDSGAPEVLSGRGETPQNALDNLKSKLAKTPSFSHCSIIALEPNMTTIQIKTALELCSQLNVSLSTKVLATGSVSELFGLEEGNTTQNLIKQNAAYFGFGGHTALFEIQTAIMVNEGKFALPFISIEENTPQVLGLCYFGEGGV